MLFNYLITCSNFV